MCIRDRLDTDAVTGAAGQRRTEAHLRNAQPRNLIGNILIDDLIPIHDNITGVGMVDRLQGHAADDPFLGLVKVAVMLEVLAQADPLARAAILLADDHILDHIHQATGQITGVRSFQGGIGKSFSGAVRGDKIFQHGEPLPEIRLDGQVDDAPGRVGHEAAHPRQLGDLRLIAPRTGMGHHVDGVEPVKSLHQGTGHLILGLAPDLDYLIIALLLGDKPTEKILLRGPNQLLRPLQDLLLVRRDHNIFDSDSDPGAGGIVKAEPFYFVQDLCCCLLYTSRCV